MDKSAPSKSNHRNVGAVERNVDAKNRRTRKELETDMVRGFIDGARATPALALPDLNDPSDHARRCGKNNAIGGNSGRICFMLAAYKRLKYAQQRNLSILSYQSLCSMNKGLLSIKLN